MIETLTALIEDKSISLLSKSKTLLLAVMTDWFDKDTSLDANG
jgi:hypothetical protein